MGKWVLINENSYNPHGASCHIGTDFGLNGVIELADETSYVSIGDGCIGQAFHISVGHGCRVEIGADCNLGALNVYTRNGSSIFIGEGTGFTWRSTLHCHEPYDIYIGKTCLFAPETSVTVSDMHAIFEVSTGRLLNRGRDVVIEDRVWLAAGSRVLKGARIGSGSILGADAVLTGVIPSNCMAAGVPAKVIKTGVSWDHRIPSDFEPPFI